MKANLKNRKVFFIAVSAFLFAFFMNYSGTILKSVEVFKTNIEIEKAEKLGYKNFSALDGSLRFSMPNTWKVWEQTFCGGEILYHLNFLSPNKKIHGFIQVWKMEKPLKEFLEESEDSPVSALELKSYSKKEILINGRKGFLVQYEKDKGNDNTYRAYESFLADDNGNIYRSSFYMSGKDWKNYHTVSFNKIIQSMKITTYEESGD